MKEHREAIVRCETKDDIRSLFELWPTSYKNHYLTYEAPHTFILCDDGCVTQTHSDIDTLREIRTANFWGTFSEYLSEVSGANISVDVDEYL